MNYPAIVVKVERHLSSIFDVVVVDAILSHGTAAAEIFETAVLFVVGFGFCQGVELWEWFGHVT